MIGRVIAVAAIVIMLFAGVGVLQEGFRSAATTSETNVDFNNSITVDNGSLHTLDSSNKSGVVYAPAADVNVTQNGQSFIEEGNWTWRRGNGTLFIKENSTLTNNTNANVKAYYVRPSGAQNATLDIGLIPTQTLGHDWPFIGGIILLLAAAGIMAGRA